MSNSNEMTIRINGHAKKFIDELDKVKKKTAELERSLEVSAKAGAVAFAALAATLVGVTKKFSDYEKALVGVGKTTNIEGANLRNFGKEFQKMSSEIPIATNELLGIAQAAGQLGVSGEKNLLKFTDTVAKLGVATDLSGEEAATALTRILNVTGEGIDTIDTFGSVIVRLGNNFAATESEITRMATEVSRSTAVFGVSAAEAAALGTALRSVGVQAQLGGSAVGRAYREIDAALRAGGKQLQELEKLTGVAGDELQRVFKEDATQVFRLFIEGIGKVQKAGGDTTAELAKFGLKGDEILKVLPVLAKESGILGDALNQAAEETKNATALNEEAAKAFDTLAADGQRLSNNLETLAVNIGEKLAPAAGELLDSVNELITGFNQMDDEALESIASFLKWSTAIAGIIAAGSAFGLMVLKVSGFLTALGTTLGITATGFAAFWAAVTGPVGIAVAGIAALTAGIIALKSELSKPEVESLYAIEKQLERLKQKKEQLSNVPVRLGGGQDEVDKLDKQIKKLEEMRQAKLRASADFGTGELLVRPKAETGELDLGAGNFGIQEQNIPFAPADEETKKLKKAAENQKEIIDAKTQTRIDAAKREAEKLREIQAARTDGATEKELEYLERRQEIEDEFAKANAIKSDAERQATLEMLTLKHAQEKAEIEKFNQEAAELRQAENERKLEQNKVFNELEKEQNYTFNEEQKARLAEQVEAEKERDARLAEEKLQRKIAEHNLFKEEEKEYGAAVAKIRQVLRSEEVKGVKETTAQLVSLTNSKNNQLKAIGKAAAVSQIAIDTAANAASIFAKLNALFPLLAPAIGAVGAAAITAFGAEKTNNVLAANTGGVVPGFGPNRDSVPAMLTPGELVVPRNNYNEVVDAVARQRGGGDGEPQRLVVELEPKGDLMNFIEAQTIERDYLNTGAI